MPESITEFEQSSLAQKASSKISSAPARISWDTISNQVMSVLNIEKGIFYTVKELLFRPGKAVRKHLFKNRTLLLNPVRFLVLSTTIATFVTFYYLEQSAFEASFEEGFVSVDTGSSTSNDRLEKALIPLLIDLFKQFVNLSYFFLVPAGALISWLFMKKQYNVPELAVAHCYLWSMVNVFTITLTPLVIQYATAAIALVVLATVYPFYFYIKFFNEGTKGFLKSLVINFLNYVLLMVFFAVFGYIYLQNIESTVFPNSCRF